MRRAFTAALILAAMTGGLRADPADDVEKLKRQLSEERAESAALKDKFADLLKQTETIRQERDQLSASLSKLQVALEKLQADAAKDREKAVLFEQRFLSIQRLLEEKQRKLEAREIGEQLAPAFVGEVTRFDEDLGIVVISFGEDAGPKPGATLKVYRLEPDPLYLGTAEVARVQAKRVICWFTPSASAKKSPPQKGDKVADKIR